MKSCPFCGITPSRAVKTDLGMTLQHPSNRCALTSLWFTLELWNRRVEQVSA